MNNSRAQGTLEYLVIIAVIVVIALVVVGILTGFLGNASDANEKASKIYWSTQPVAITDSLADYNGGARIVVKNNTDETITLDEIIANEISNSINIGSGQELAMGSTYTASLSGIPDCIVQKQAYNLTIKYTSSFGLNKQVGPKELIVSCTDNPIITVSVGDDSITISGSGVSGALPVWDGSEWVFSADGEKGILIDQNALCFGASCSDANIDWNGTDLIFNG